MLVIFGKPTEKSSVTAGFGNAQVFLRLTIPSPFRLGGAKPQDRNAAGGIYYERVTRMLEARKAYAAFPIA